LERARLWFRSIGVAVDEVIADNGANSRSKKFVAQFASRANSHIFTRPYRPQTDGKAERFNRTLADEFFYAYKFRSEPDRRRRLQIWIHHYHLHRHHSTIDGTPASRAHNLYGHYN
jgi:transposase InsO family protein